MEQEIKTLISSLTVKLESVLAIGKQIFFLLFRTFISELPLPIYTSKTPSQSEITPNIKEIQLVNPLVQIRTIIFPITGKLCRCLILTRPQCLTKELKLIS